MTEDQKKLGALFESRVTQLMCVCDQLRQENAELKQQTEELRYSNSVLEKENRTIKIKYDNLKIARIISVKQDDFKGAKNQLSQLVKEVDQCIALLNE
jgi:predicted RNase H-like nuclease (RuvC/YqgF family)